MLYLASRPCPSAIFHVVHERMRYFNWFIVFPFFKFLNGLVTASVSATSSFVLVLEMEFEKKNSAGQIISPSLLRPWKWDFEYEYNPDFDLGIGDWMSDSDNEDVLFDDDLLFGKENERESSGLVAGPPSAKRQRLSLKLSGKKKVPLADSSNRFAAPVDKQTLEKASEGLKPGNTEANTR